MCPNFSMFRVKLRKSRLEILKSSGQVVTYNCLNHVDSAITELVELQSQLEGILCQSRKVIAQTIHAIEYILTEFQSYFDCVQLDGACVMTVRLSFLNLRFHLADYVAAYQVEFLPDYRFLLASVSQYDFYSCRNVCFRTDLRQCTSLGQLADLVECHGGQVDYEDYLPLLNSFHDQFSFVRNLIRDVRSSHTLATRFLSIIGPLLQCFDHFSERSVREDSGTESVFKFVKSSNLLIESIRGMDVSDACDFFEKRTRLLERSSVHASARVRSYTHG